MISFKKLPSALDTASPPVKAALELMLRVASQYRQRFLLNIFYAVKTRPFQLGYNFLKQKNPEGAKSGEYRGWVNVTIRYFAGNVRTDKAV